MSLQDLKYAATNKWLILTNVVASSITYWYSQDVTTTVLCFLGANAGGYLVGNVASRRMQHKHHVLEIQIMNLRAVQEELRDIKARRAELEDTYIPEEWSK